MLSNDVHYNGVFVIVGFVIEGATVLVSFSVQSKQLLCFVQGQGQKKGTETNKELCRVFLTIPLY